MPKNFTEQNSRNICEIFRLCKTFAASFKFDAKASNLSKLIIKTCFYS